MERRVALLATGTAAAAILLLLFLAGRAEPPPGPVPPSEADTITGTLDVPGVVPGGSPLVSPSVEADPALLLEDPRAPGRVRLPVEVAVIDVESGRPIPDARPSWIVRKGNARPLAPGGGYFRHPDLTVELRSTVRLRFSVELPDGYGLARPDGFEVTGTVSIYAERVRVTIPVWPVAIVVVRVLDHEQNPVAGAVISSVSLSGRSRSFTADTTDADGWTFVRGIPALRGEAVGVKALANGRSRTVMARIADCGTEVRLVAVLPKDPDRRNLGIGGGAGGAFGGRGGHRNLLVNPAIGSVCVLVLHREGRPAVDTTVIVSGGGRERTGRTDASGRVLLEHLTAGKVSIRVREAGFVTGKVSTVDVPAGGVADVTMREAPERWLWGQVLDESGRALPGASVVLRCAAWPRLVWLDRGLQRLNLLTGPEGRFEFPNAPPGAVVVQAAYGSRSARAGAAETGASFVRFSPKK
ncbi:MAG: carboxypeptidase-like regulatory domain-containing protein [Planctomycetota bacterium]